MCKQLILDQYYDVSDLEAPTLRFCCVGPVASDIGIFQLLPASSPHHGREQREKVPTNLFQK